MTAINIQLPDDILHNIFARLSAKPLLRCTCVSTHWNRLISDTWFKKSISRPKILLYTPSLFVEDVNVAIDNTAESVVLEIRKPLTNYFNIRQVKMVGTFNGIVLMVLVCYNDGSSLNREHDTRHMILYNPFTRASKIVPDPYTQVTNSAQSYGFCYGASPDDLKIVRLRYTNPWTTCDVINLKNGMWNMPKILAVNNFFEDSVGTFVKGFLYWLVRSEEIVALNVNEMVVSKIQLPYPDFYRRAPLGTLHGQLCLIFENLHDAELYAMWVLKEHVENTWSKSYSFTIKIDSNIRVMQPMDDGRILLTDSLAGGSLDVVTYDLLKQTYKTLRSDLLIERFGRSVSGMEYAESLTSPSEICFV